MQVSAVPTAQVSEMVATAPVTVAEIAPAVPSSTVYALEISNTFPDTATAGAALKVWE